ncbi:MAG: RNA polymerase sigma factor [Limisphaerales bacterium]
MQPTKPKRPTTARRPCLPLRSQTAFAFVLSFRFSLWRRAFSLGLMPERRTRTHRLTRVGFDTTNWTLVMMAVNQSLPGSRQALEQLCLKYWRPIYAFLRRQGNKPEDAKDLAQGFFVHLLQGHRLRRIHPSKGRLRSFLLAGLQEYTQNQRDWARAQKRGGGQIRIPMDAVEPVETQDPARAFDSQWAAAIFERALGQLKERCRQAGNCALFEALEPFLTAEAERGDYGQLAGQMHTTENTLRTAVSRLRAEFRDLLRAEVAATVDKPGQIEEETRYLLPVVNAV